MQISYMNIGLGSGADGLSRHELYRKQADKEGKSLSRWVRDLLDLEIIAHGKSTAAPRNGTAKPV